jgi:hypothetical protein
MALAAHLRQLASLALRVSTLRTDEIITEWTISPRSFGIVGETCGVNDAALCFNITGGNAQPNYLILQLNALQKLVIIVEEGPEVVPRHGIDVRAPPFNADPTGVVDATAALQAALDFGRAHYLATFLPGGTYVVSQTMRMIQAEKTFMTTGGGAPNCNNMVEIFGQTPKPMPHCGRTQPYVLQGSTANSSSRAILLVKKATGLKGYVTTWCRSTTR